MAETARSVARPHGIAKDLERSALCFDISMLLDEPQVNEITGQILGAAIEVHRVLGPGLLESVYCACLQYELTVRGMRFEVQRHVPIRYKQTVLATSLHVDLIVENLVVVEVKAVSELLPVHRAQTLTYVRLTHCAAGLVINFNVPRLMDGVKRVINPGVNPAGHFCWCSAGLQACLISPRGSPEGLRYVTSATSGASCCTDREWH